MIKDEEEGEEGRRGKLTYIPHCVVLFCVCLLKHLLVVILQMRVKEAPG